MSKQKKLANRLFDLYSKNLSLYVPDLQNLFACPICLTLFSRDSIEQELVTLEHIVPESLGGKFRTLTCKTCNNDTKANIESHLKNKLKSEEFSTGASNEKIRGTLSIGGANATVDIKYVSDQGKEIIDIVGLPHLSNPKEFEKVNNAFSEGKSINLNISVKEPFKKNLAYTTYIKSAYLMMFRTFGYGYILYRAVTDPIRNQIIEPNNTGDVLWSIVSPNPEAPMEPYKVYACFTEGVPCFLSVLDFNLGKNPIVGCLLPVPIFRGKEFYSWLKETKDNALKFELTVKGEVDRQADKLIHPKYKNRVFDVWEELGVNLNRNV